MSPHLLLQLWSPLRLITDPRSLIYHFSDSDVLNMPTISFEDKLFAAIRNLGITGIRVFKTEGISRNHFHTLETLDVYQISSETHHCKVNFCLEKERGNIIANVLLLWTPEEFQGNGIRVRRFIKILADILFASGVDMLAGKAAPPEGKEIKRGKDGEDWRIQRRDSGNCGLVDFYLACGFEKVEGSPDGLFMSVEQFQASRIASDKNLRTVGA